MHFEVVAKGLCNIYTEFMPDIKTLLQHNHSARGTQIRTKYDKNYR